jgi:hypothetical protein
MTGIESSRIFLNSKERKTLSKIKQFTLEKLFKQLRVNFRFIKILFMHALALTTFQLDPKDVVSAGGNLIIGSPYSNYSELFDSHLTTYERC